VRLEFVTAYIAALLVLIASILIALPPAIEIVRFIGRFLGW
jgi:hypothetical protein